MQLNEIRKLAALMGEMGLTSLEYSENGAEIRMRRDSGHGCAAQAAPAAGEEARPEPKGEAPDGAHTVTSPMVGVFYAAPGPDKASYVSIGDRVEAGDVLCIIEAMKMMNEITADVSGVVTEICAGDKQIVEYGHPLFRIRPE